MRSSKSARLTSRTSPPSEARPHPGYRKPRSGGRFAPLLDRAQLFVDQSGGDASHGEAVEQATDDRDRVSGNELQLQHSFVAGVVGFGSERVGSLRIAATPSGSSTEGVHVGPLRGAISSAPLRCCRVDSASGFPGRHGGSLPPDRAEPRVGDPSEISSSGTERARQTRSGSAPTAVDIATVIKGPRRVAPPRQHGVGICESQAALFEFARRLRRPCAPSPAA